MVSLIGRTLVLLALGACAAGGVAGLVAGKTRSPQAWKLSIAMGLAFAALMTLATGVMEYALLVHDFSVSYVAQVGSTSTPVAITMVSLWSSLEGSILFWGFVLAAATGVFAWSMRTRDPEHGSYALGVLLLIGAFFTFLVAGVANPFLPTPGAIPLDGPGPNALLQNHVLMIIHPPALYMGYVTMAVPFAMAASALLAGRLEASWMRSLRRWTLFSWSWLSLGLLLGGWWSYEVLGWGGYWAWDPVENAAFMPWLTATAFVHSSQVMERRGQFKGWTLTLGLASFLLTMLGTFMTRSGVFNSVHAFGEGPIGPIFLGFIAVCLVFSLLLLGLRLHHLEPKNKMAGVVSREAVFLLNNLLFVALTFTVLIGTLYPLIREAYDGARISVGEPYFNKMSLPVMVAILFFMGVGPALPWGDGNLERAGKRLAVPTAVSVVVGAVLFALGVRDFWPLATFVTAAFAGVTSIRELIEPAVNRAKKKGENLLVAWWQYASRSRAKVGAYTAHLGIVALAIGIGGSAGYKQVLDVTLTQGEAQEVLGYTLVFEGYESQQQPHRRSEVTWVRVYRGDRDLGLVDPRMNHYDTMAQPIGTPAVISAGPGYFGRLAPSEDLYLSLTRLSDDHRAVSVRVMTHPVIWWVWIGGLMLFGGGLLASWPGLVKLKEKRGAKTKQTVDA